jgi:sialate O-acetylesterase
MNKRRLLIAGLSLALINLASAASLSLPGVFAHNMVLQRDGAVPVWGMAEPGQTVAVAFGGQSHDATAGPDGQWLVRLDPMAANTNSQSLTITVPGITNLVYTNVVVGDVWLASGQSNMDGFNTPVSYVTSASTEIATANYPLIRAMKLQRHAAEQPLWAPLLSFSWTPCSPAVLASSPWSATAYFFARTLFRSNNVPIGILESAYGGTRIEAWTSVGALNAVPELKTLADQQLAEYSQGLRSLKDTPGSLFNSLISPLVPYAICGVIWYQGEQNGSEGKRYRVLFPTMIQDWRDRWQQPDFPFYFVQLPNYSDPDWTTLREAQLLTLQTATNTGMAVTIDIGEATDIHPHNKQDVGIRLAYLALNRNFGFTSVVPSGPLFRSSRIEGSQIRLYFEHAEGGLMTGFKNGLAPVQEVVGAAPNWFEISGANQTYYPATARIEVNNTVVVFSPSVPSPTQVRYAWFANPVGFKLYNRAGLPASPFRIPVWTNSPPVATAQINAGSIQSACFVPSNVTWWVEFRDDLGAPAWAPLVLPQTGTGSVQTVTDPMNGRARRFYRWLEVP